MWILFAELGNYADCLQILMEATALCQHPRHKNVRSGLICLVGLTKHTLANGWLFAFANKVNIAGV